MDLSLYKEESQLKKRKGKKRKATTPLKTDTKTKSTKKSPETAKVRKVAAAPKLLKQKKTGKVKKVIVKKQQPIVSSSSEVKKAVVQGRAERAAKRRGADVAVSSRSPVVDQKKAKVLAKVARKNVQKTHVKSE